MSLFGGRSGRFSNLAKNQKSCCNFQLQNGDHTFVSFIFITTLFEGSSELLAPEFLHIVMCTAICRLALVALSLLAVSEGFLAPQAATQKSSPSLSPFLVSSNTAPSLSVALKPLYAVGTSSTGDEATFIDSDFRLAGIFLTGGLFLCQLPILKFTLGPPITLLGLLFLVQTFRLNFVCDSTSFELLNTSQENGENIVVGGANRWTYDSFVNYEFFPKGWIDQPQGPILVYFKETQTPSDEWNKGPGQSANSEEALAKGAVPGQVHFFPALCNCQQLKSEWEKRGCAKL